MATKRKGPSGEAKVVPRAPIELTTATRRKGSQDEGADNEDTTKAVQRQRGQVLKRIQENIENICKGDAVGTYTSGPKQGNVPVFKVFNLTIDVNNALVIKKGNEATTKILEDYKKWLKRVPLQTKPHQNTKDELTTLFVLLTGMNKKLSEVAASVPRVDDEMLEFCKSEGIDLDASVFSAEELAEAPPSKKAKKTNNASKLSDKTKQKVDEASKSGRNTEKGGTEELGDPIKVTENTKQKADEASKSGRNTEEGGTEELEDPIKAKDGDADNKKNGGDDQEVRVKFKDSDADNKKNASDDEKNHGIIEFEDSDTNNKKNASDEEEKHDIVKFEDRDADNKKNGSDEDKHGIVEFEDDDAEKKNGGDDEAKHGAEGDDE